jgi:hypothetical protein
MRRLRLPVRVKRLPIPLSRHPQIFRRFLAAVRDDIECDLGAFGQRREAGPFDRRYRDENVLAAGVRLNEAITLLAVEPLHCPTRHDVHRVVYCRLPSLASSARFQFQN